MKDYLYYNSRDEFMRIDIAQIVYFAANGNYTDIVLANKQRCTLGLSMSQMENYLTDNLKEKARCFVRIGKSCIVNLNHIYRINVPQQFLMLSTDNLSVYKLAISKDALKKLKELMVRSVQQKREELR
ncbi:MAG: LytTR family DNA-binding domain-containing protein [Bacteroidales bacterium]|nr:LytTR family DNA-binding domain-containing protein [Bacteroidales bacterium]